MMMNVSDRTKAASEVIDWQKVNVGASYDGPVIDDEGISLDFVMRLIEHFKAQKNLALR